jgi:hypothetical protein
MTTPFGDDGVADVLGAMSHSLVTWIESRELRNDR